MVKNNKSNYPDKISGTTFCDLKLGVLDFVCKKYVFRDYAENLSLTDKNKYLSTL